MLPVGREFLWVKDPKRRPQRFVVTHTPTTNSDGPLKSTDVYWARSLDGSQRNPFVYNKDTGRMESAMSKLRCKGRYPLHVLSRRGWRRTVALEILCARHEDYSPMNQVVERLRKFEERDDEYKRGALSLFCYAMSAGSGSGASLQEERRLLYLLRDPPPFLIQGCLRRWRQRLQGVKQEGDPAWLLRTREQGWNSQMHVWDAIEQDRMWKPCLDGGFKLGAADVIRLVTSPEHFRA